MVLRDRLASLAGKTIYVGDDSSGNVHITVPTTLHQGVPTAEITEVFDDHFAIRRTHHGKQQGGTIIYAIRAVLKISIE